MHHVDDDDDDDDDKKWNWKRYFFDHKTILKLSKEETRKKKINKLQEKRKQRGT
jgi:hypothetical protein